MKGSIQWLLKQGFWRDEEGQDLVEYALLIALVAVAAVAFIPGLTTSIQGVFTRIGTALNGAGG